MPGRVLIVDDEKDLVKSLKTGLERFGFNVDAYDDPLIALANFKSTKYDIAVLDIRMPNLNGFELYKELRKIDGQTSFCFLTAFDIYLSEFEKMFPDSGVKTFFKKPIGVGKLAKQLNAIMTHRQESSAE